MANRQSNPEEKIRYLVQRNGEDVVLELPANWRITFGYVNPSNSGDAYRKNEGHCLRVYEGEKLRGVFANVTGFRDLSIPFAKKFEKETGSAQWESDSEGSFERNESRQIETGFVIDDDVNPFEEQ